MSDIKEFKLGELFCGPGGLAWGALHASVPGMKIEHAWANDYDSETCETYRKNICPGAPQSVICEDIHKLNIKKLGQIDALAFGFPCNDYSIVGKKKGLQGSFGPLYTYGVKALKYNKPQWFLAENVRGLRSDNGGDTLQLIMKDMKKAGYRLYPHLYKFEEYGVPQARHRIIIIGIRKDLPFEFRVPSTEAYTDANVSSRFAIENPPIPKDATNNELTRQSPAVVARLKYIKPGQNAFNEKIPKIFDLCGWKQQKYTIYESHVLFCMILFFGPILG